MKALPKWQKLKDQYRDDGLRVIMIHTQDPGVPCGEGVKGLADDVVCDAGKVSIAKWLRAHKELPASFLWSRQGHLLVNNASVEAVGDG